MRIAIHAALIGLITASPALASEEAKRAAARENFIQADSNSDTKLTKTEFRNFINANAEDKIGNASKVKRFGAYDRAFKKVDTNGDGFVTGEEMAAAKK